jgi:diguanylate cyclase (GGDEF)-like protein
MSFAKSRVLLVDDDPDTLALLTGWLESAGYHVSQAANGEQAMAAIEARCPHYMVTGWDMPVMDGPELCRQMRARELPHYVYTLFLTSRQESSDMVTALEVGADDFLHKPVAKEELIARLRAGSRVLEMERRLCMLANSDPLTGLNNKRMFFEHFEREWSRAKRHNINLSCVLIDIDFFKRINDTYGHPTGDVVLKNLAKVLGTGCRQSDIVCRYGGEEFLVLLPETNEEQATLWAERMRETLRATDVKVDGAKLQLTASFGVAQLMPEIERAEELVDRADQCLLVAKRSGRDRVVQHASLRHLIEIHRNPNTGYGAIFSGVTARDVMTTIVAGLHQDATVGGAAEYFLRFRINSAPVVDLRGKLIGFVSDKDLMNVLLWPDCWNRPILDVMRPNVICYEEDTPILVIYEFLCRVAIRSVVVVVDGAPTGLIHRGSLLRWFSNSVAQRRAAANPSPLDETFDLRDRLADVAGALAHQASVLKTNLEHAPTGELIAHLVGGTSRVQELANDLLAFSPYLNNARDETSVGLMSSGNQVANDAAVYVGEPVIATGVSVG